MALKYLWYENRPKCKIHRNDNDNYRIGDDDNDDNYDEIEDCDHSYDNVLSPSLLNASFLIFSSISRQHTKCLNLLCGLTFITLKPFYVAFILSYTE